MTDKSMDIRLKDALSPSYIPGEDVNTALIEKLRKTGEKYPVEKARGSAVKYDKL